MADPLYLSLWFPTFAPAEMMTRAVSVLRQFPFSVQRPGVAYLTIQPVSWSEPTVLEQRIEPGLAPEEAAELAAELLHADYAYVFEVFWDLWTLRPDETPPEIRLDPKEEWALQPAPVKVVVQGTEFDEGSFQESGHVQVELGLDTPFLYEDVALSPKGAQRIRANVQKLVQFTTALEQNAALSGRVLWSESEENLAQKLIARLQQVQ